MRSSDLKRWATPATVIFSGLLVAASIVFIGRYEISAEGFGYGANGDEQGDNREAVFRLDRWTGEIDYCLPGGDIEKMKKGTLTASCSLPVPNQ